MEFLFEWDIKLKIGTEILYQQAAILFYISYVFCLLYKHTNDVFFDGFPKIFEYFPKISEDFRETTDDVSIIQEHI